MRKTEELAGDLAPGSMARVRTVEDLSRLLRQLRRREARRRGGAQRTYRELAARTGWSLSIVGDYLAGKVLPPTDRFDVLVALLGATRTEQCLLATARDRVDDLRRSAGPAGLPGARVVPRQIPADVAGFTGREAALDALDALLEPAASSSAMVISVVSGTAGVGKTALAVHWAHRVASRFPDGQLYLDLEGYGPGQPLAADAALSTLLRGLGAPEVPGNAAERAAHYRTLLAGRRVLVVLDNACAADQVRPLLPGGPSCLVLVTSRDDLAGLVARDGARRVELDVLRPGEALGLLSRLIGSPVDRDPSAVAALAGYCAGLPLALRVAAELVTEAGSQDGSLARLVEDLRDERRRLEILDANGDPRAAVAAVFSWSYRRLTPEEAQLFALLGQHPGRSVDEYAAAQLAGIDIGTLRRRLSALARAHLVQRAAGGRHTMHDLLRAYAAQRAAADLDSHTTRAALSRLLDYYRARAAAATAAFFPYQRSGSPADPGDDPAAAAWLAGEIPNLVAAATLAADLGWGAYALGLSRALWRYLDVRGRYHEALALHAAAARTTDDDPAGRAAALASLALAQERLGHRADASRSLRSSLRLSREAGDVAGEARALGTLGAVQAGLGRYPQSEHNLCRALGLYQRLGDRHGEAVVLGYLGLLHDRLGGYQEAARLQRRAATAFREAGDPRLEGYALANLGVVHSNLGQHADALDHLGRALTRCEAAQDRAGTGQVLGHLGTVYSRLGRHAEAVDHLDRALAIGRDTGNASTETATLNALGETWRAMGQPARGYESYQAALGIAERTGHRRQQAQALDGLGLALRDLGRLDEARQRWRQALTVYEDLHLPEAAVVRRRLQDGHRP